MGQRKRTMGNVCPVELQHAIGHLVGKNVAIKQKLCWACHLPPTKGAGGGQWKPVVGRWGLAVSELLTPPSVHGKFPISHTVVLQEHQASSGGGPLNAREGAVR